MSCCGPTSSGRAGRIVRNLTSSNGRPPRPLRAWWNSTGRTVDDPHRDGDRREQRRGDHQQRGRDDDVDRPLHHDRGPTARRAATTSTTSPTATMVAATAIVSVRAAVRAMATAKPACRPINAAGCIETGTIGAPRTGEVRRQRGDDEEAGHGQPGEQCRPAAGCTAHRSPGQHDVEADDQHPAGAPGSGERCQEEDGQHGGDPDDVIGLRHAEVEAERRRRRPPVRPRWLRAAGDGGRRQAAHGRHAGSAATRPRR